MDLDFQPPAQAAFAMDATSVEWVLFLFHETASDMALQWPSTSSGWNLTLQRARVNYLGTKGVESTLLELEDERGYGPLNASLGFASNDWGSLYVQGNGIRLHVENALAQLKGSAGGACAHDLLTAGEFMSQPARAAAFCPKTDQAVTVIRPTAGNASLSFQVESTQVDVAEWHNSQIKCESRQSCPERGERRQDWTSTGAASIGNEVRTYERLTSSQAAAARLQGSGSAVAIFAGSGRLDLAVDGWLRLPHASGDLACDGCHLDGETLQASGTIRLTAVRMTQDGDLAASLDGEFTDVRVDEASISPGLLLATSFGAVAVAASAGLLLLVKALGGFTRVLPQEARSHPRRRAIQEYLIAKPGAGFRELMRGTGSSSASLRRHLEILKQTGHIVEQKHGRSRRFMPVGIHFEQRNSTILLREQTLAELHSLVERNPWLAQSEIMDLAARDLAHSRSTTQHRLGRLLKGGLLTVRRTGRYRLYAVAGSHPTNLVSLDAR
jgi:DNA-binding transcriptional ArsR family regulator